MNKNRIRLSESQLRNIIRNAIKEECSLPQAFYDMVKPYEIASDWDDIEDDSWHKDGSRAYADFGNRSQYPPDADSAYEYHRPGGLSLLAQSPEDGVYHDWATSDKFKSLKEQNKIGRNRVRLSESQLHRIIRESVMNVLRRK